MGEHDGHRARMRERFRASGLDGFAPHEVLELLLFYGRTRGDTNPAAHALMDTFGSLRGVLEASPEQLMTVKGIGEESATLISLILPLFRRYSQCITETQNCIQNRAQADAYCRALLAGRRTEHFFCICLSSEGKVLGQKLIAEGTACEVQAYPRKVLETALNQNAQCIILCHNHPDGNCIPSEADISATRDMLTLLAGVQITLLDHLIIAGDSSYSMAQHHHL